MWIFLWVFVSSVDGRNIFNQTAGYQVTVNFDTWTNFGDFGGCVTCPYTCVKPTVGPDGKALNFSNTTQFQTIPAAFQQTQQNGCCFAAKSKSTQQPDCNNAAVPETAEDCGFLYGPTLEWEITWSNPPKDPLSAILFASIDCINFWAVGREYVKQDPQGKAGFVEGSSIINGGCYGDPEGDAIVLAGCLTTQLKFDKSKGYTWEMLAEKCQGLSGQCSRTNGLWGRNLKCCTDLAAIQGSAWDLTYSVYTKDIDAGTVLSGPAIFGIVIGGVAFMMCLVHYGAKVRERARQTALMREQEASDDYEEIITPLTGDQQPMQARRPMAGAPSAGALELSLHEGDQIFHKEDPELLYEGDMY